MSSRIRIAEGKTLVRMHSSLNYVGQKQKGRLYDGRVQTLFVLKNPPAPKVLRA